MRCESAETLLRAVIDNDEGVKGAIRRENWLAARDVGYLQDLADSLRVLLTVTERVYGAKLAKLRSKT